MQECNFQYLIDNDSDRNEYFVNDDDALTVRDDIDGNNKDENDNKTRLTRCRPSVFTSSELKSTECHFCIFSL